MSPNTELWSRVDELVSPTRKLNDLRAHHLQLLAANRWRRLGVPIPYELLLEERGFAARRLAVDMMLRKVREAAPGPMLVFKGPETAAHYLDAGLRPFVDVDLLVPDPETTHRLLLEAGFVSFGNEQEYYDGLHHVQPVRWSRLPLSLELHHHPNWIGWTSPPSSEELFEGAVAARVGPSGVLAFDPVKHALILAVNSWADVPLRRMLDLIDIAAVLGEIDPVAVQRLADEWDVGHVWRTTASAMNYLLFGDQRPVSLRIWARGTAAVRDDTVSENHIRRLASTFWAVPLHRAPGLFLRMVAEEMMPSDDESWRRKLRRTFVALRNAFRKRSHHEQLLGDDAHLFQRRSRESTRARDRARDAGAARRAP